LSEEIVFWAEKIAKGIQGRKKFHFLDKPIPEIKNPTVKSSSSLSGVLHIGRLSDIIRGEAVFRSLKENNSKVEFIYVTEDMDPLRKVPKGVPASFNEYVGVPVSTVPDPEGCHSSYGEHFKEKFLDIFDGFLTYEPKLYSMSQEYKKGNFTPYILELVKKTQEVRGIIQRFQDSKISENWTSWKPICEKCGNLQTTVVTKINGDHVDYVCKDYSFEKTKAVGCGHEGTSHLKKAHGKLIWKSEWAAQWKRWGVVSEGAGKEYNAPNSAWFVNAEICEKVLDYPMPEPIFYEHLFIDGQKMSASIGNVVYPHEWLEVGRPEALKLLYMKKLAKARSFSWKALPLLEAELDKAAEAIASKGGKTKEQLQLGNLYRYSSVSGRKVLPIAADYSLVAYLASLFKNDSGLLGNLSETGQISASLSSEEKKQLLERVSHARKWVEKYALDNYKIGFAEKIGPEVKKLIPKEAMPALLKISVSLEGQKSVDDVQKLIFETSKENEVNPKLVFEALYLALIAKPKGPKIGTLVFAFGKRRVAERLREIAG